MLFGNHYFFLKTLEDLNVEANNITGVGAKELAEALKQNTVIYQLAARSR